MQSIFQKISKYFSTFVKYLFNIGKVFFNNCKVFFQHLQSILFQNLLLSLMFSIGLFSCPGSMQSIFFICFKTRKIGEIYIFLSLSKTERRNKIGPKSQPIYPQIL